MKYEHNTNKRSKGLTWKKVLIIGTILGVILGGYAYLTLELADRQLRAQEHANSVEQQHREWRKYMERTGNPQPERKPVNSISLGSVGFSDGEQWDIQAAQGYRRYQPTYDPQLAEDVKFKGVSTEYTGIRLSEHFSNLTDGESYTECLMKWHPPLKACEL